MNDDQTTGAESTLDDLCRRAAELIGATAGPLKSVRLRSGDMSVEVEWPDAAPSAPAGVPVANGAMAAFPGVAPPGVPGGGAIAESGAIAAAAVATAGDGAAAAVVAADPGTFEVTAPLVGTLYRAPSPGARPFVEVGDDVEEGQQVAIVEAMKLMNPVTAERPGRVVEVLVDDAGTVEYGQPILRLAPPSDD
ncbi:MULTISPECIES: acetyl-CoA carboxylase biotin carboxyl carrier protein [Actinomadura]|uniref:Biotin carboxyl carrier protein of acetyl-CoA carboxylase n=1 Tax=Actinomadura yumaensis TaxID=111807 RepID=A0ABW2CQR9_9ACTN|nr:biotin/lipoyl-containing protein [Actinomadura sp. J1-007]MWK36679.1 acetyl-CoA carboxylase, biotin carboxyl carrier protein [Actinomadura sp. J1-007]